jgi:transcriptional regulator with XRE-family HTH domain
MNQCPVLRGVTHGISAAGGRRNANLPNRKWRNIMATAILKSSKRPGPGRTRSQDTDRHVGARMRERRMMLGLTQHQMAELIGVTYQQAHKYEKGINRVAAGRLYHIARALGVEVGYFFEGLRGNIAFKATPQQRLLLELGRNVIAIPIRKHQEAICSLTRTLVEPGARH